MLQKYFNPLYLTIFIIIWFVSCSPNHILLENSGKTLLKKKINNLLIEAQLNASIGIDIRSLKSGTSIYSYQKNKPLTPASNSKIYTSGAALMYLGLDYKFKTIIYSKGNNLFIKGNGDPNFSLNNLDSLAKLVSLSFETIDTLIADESTFDSNQFGPGWMWDEGHWWHAAPVNALILNDNCVDFFIQPKTIGEPINLEIIPNTRYIKVINNSYTVSDSLNLKKFSINRDWRNQTNNFTILGNKVQSSLIDTLKRNIHNPALFTATIFAERLSHYKVPIKHIKTGKTHRSATPHFKHLSKSLLQINQNMMHESDNLTAEVLTKTIGSLDSIPGNWKTGLKTIKSILADSAKMDTNDMKLADGSGLSRYNLSSAQNFTHFLDYIYQSQYRDSFVSSMPFGGSEGTLKERLIEIGPDIRAKTGSLSGVNCLSGYIFSKGYGPLAFSILINGYTGSSLPYKQLQDKIVTLLRNY